MTVIVIEHTICIVMYHLNLLFLALYLFFCHCNGLIPQHLLTRHVTSAQMWQNDQNGDCYFPPFCDLDITRCNIPKVSIHDLTSSEFHDIYYGQKPVVIQFCPDKSVDCDLSSVIDMSSNLFEWRNIASIVLSPQQYDAFLSVDRNGTCDQRADFTTIYELDPRVHRLKPIYDGIHQPQLFDQIDIYNDLIGFLSTSDIHSVTSNKWIIFGTTGGGATWHHDYYFTSFWNMGISGSKYWVLMDQSDVINVWNDSTKRIHEVERMTNLEFFDDIYLNGFLEEEYKRIKSDHKQYECIQEPGDMIYLPPFVYHATANLEQTLAVSQNLISRKEYVKTFRLLGNVIRDRERELDSTKYSIYAVMELCAALNHYDAELFANSVCATNGWINKLDIVMDDGGKLYDDVCSFAQTHSQYSDFRA